eukprot:287148-Prymnesium_polylepis.1
MAALLLVTTVATAEFDLELLITADVRGAAFPVNQLGTQCSLTELNSTPCDCFGGASRRRQVISSAGNNSVVLDAGSYFFWQRPLLPRVPGQRVEELLRAGRVRYVGACLPRFPGRGILCRSEWRALAVSIHRGSARCCLRPAPAGCFQPQRERHASGRA